jgi:phosphoglycolate phosphatase-like HAD superfamily hydrolase
LNYRGIIFDMDGTLVDSFHAIHGSLTEAMQRVGLAPWDLETTKQHVGRGIGYLVESAVGATKKEEAAKIFRQDYGETCLARTFLLPSVSETLPLLRASGVRLAVATNKALAFTERILAHLEIDRYFECVLGPEAVARPKPHPDMIDTILARLELAKEVSLYVGDMPLDVETASWAGLDCLLVATGPYGYPTLQREVSVPVLEAFAEIPHFLQME